MKRTLIGALVLAALSSTAQADVYSWTGLYFGANAGYAWGKDRSVTFSPNDIIASDEVGTPSPITYNSRGGLAGVQIGYNWQIARSWLVGLETDLDFSNIRGRGTSSVTIEDEIDVQDVNLIQSASERIKWFGTLRGRLGFLVTDNVLIYGTGGFAYGRVSQTLSLFNNSSIAFAHGIGDVSLDCERFTTCFAGSSTRTRAGWTVGGGLEFAAWDRWRVKAEYLFVHFSGNQFNESAVALAFDRPIPSSYTTQFSEMDFHVARVGLNYSFGGPLAGKGP